MLARTISSASALAVSFGIALGSYAIFLAAIGRVFAMGNFFSYAWIAGGLGFVASLFLCSIKPKSSMLVVAIIVLIAALAIPSLNLLPGPGHSTLGRVVRWTVFLTHLPLTAACGVLASILVYRSIRSLEEN